jgi:hypothetical protein
MSVDWFSRVFSGFWLFFCVSQHGFLLSAWIALENCATAAGLATQCSRIFRIVFLCINAVGVSLVYGDFRGWADDTLRWAKRLAKRYSFLMLARS